MADAMFGDSPDSPWTRSPRPPLHRHFIADALLIDRARPSAFDSPAAVRRPEQTVPQRRDLRPSAAN